jgi:hypothetical protein
MKLNATTKAKNLLLLLFVVLNINVNSSDSISVCDDNCDCRIKSSDINAYVNSPDLIPYSFSLADDRKFFLKNLKINSLNSIPIAEYCTVHEKKLFYNYTDDCDCSGTHDSVYVYLRLEKKMQEQPNIKFCITNDYSYDFYWVNKFLIHGDLKAEQIEWSLFIGFINDHFSDPSEYIRTYRTTAAKWYFAPEVPIYAKDTILVDLKKYSKYYEKGRIIPVEWKLYAKCDSTKTVYSGSYFIRITGECK